MDIIRKAALAAAFLGAAGLAAPALAHEGHGKDKKDKTISAGKLARDAKDFYGRTVSVKSEVETVIDAHSFTLDEDAVFAGPDVLVLVPAGLVSGVRKDDKVVVTGTVRRYVTAELDRDFDWFEEGRIVNPGVEVDFKSRPVVVAQSIRTADGRELLSGAAVPAASGMHGHGHDHGATTAHTTRPQEPAMATISASKLVRDAKEFYGRTVSVRAEVEKVLNDHSFTLDEDAVFAGPDVLVLMPTGVATRLREDDKVTVTGVVRQYVAAELERDLDFFDEGKLVKREYEVDYKTRPVIVATSVLTADGRDLMVASTTSR